MQQSERSAVDAGRGSSVLEPVVNVTETDHLTSAAVTSSLLSQTTSVCRRDFSVMIPLRPSSHPQPLPACHQTSATEQHHSAITPACHQSSATEDHSLITATCHQTSATEDHSLITPACHTHSAQHVVCNVDNIFCLLHCFFSLTGSDQIVVVTMIKMVFATKAGFTVDVR